MNLVPPIRDKKQNRLHLGQSWHNVWRQHGPVGCGVTVGRNLLQCNVGFTLLHEATRQQQSRPTSTRGHLTEACKVAHEGS